jgi:predicted GNAT superfamily acetyltransferase
MMDIEIRQCVSHEEFEPCVQLQRLVWQFSDVDLVPAHIFIVCHKTGGFTLGAFTASDELVGFAYALMARRGEKLCYHSDMLAVHPRYQGQGIGHRLKLGQRDYALKQGVDLIVWTFDPLQALNAHFNINKLGVVARTYEVNCYGSASSSHLHQGLDTDRLLVEWWLDSQRVRHRLTDVEITSPPPVATVKIPADINSLKARDVEAARAWQLQVRQQFLEHFASGLYVGGFEPLGDGSTYQYLLYPGEP